MNLEKRHLYGDPESFSKIADAKVVENNASMTLEFTHLNPDEHMGYLGNLDCQISYSLSKDNVRYA